MSISVVQLLAASSTTNSTSIQSSAFGSSPTTGNTILVCVTGQNNTSTTTLSLSDTAGNSYTCLYANGYVNGSTNVLANPASNNITSGTAFVSIWAAANITGGSSFKITATWGASGSSSSLDISAAEVSGIGTSVTVDVTQPGNGSSTGNPSTGSFSTSNANDIILVAMEGVSSSTGDSITIPSGYTQIGQFTVASVGKRLLSFCYKIVSSTQSSINPAFATSNVSSATAIAVAVEQAAGGGGSSIFSGGNRAGCRSPRKGLVL